MVLLQSNKVFILHNFSKKIYRFIFIFIYYTEYCNKTYQNIIYDCNRSLWSFLLSAAGIYLRGAGGPDRLKYLAPLQRVNACVHANMLT